METVDLLDEHRILEAEAAWLRKLCLEEWETMSANVARGRQQRLDGILGRLAAIERTQSWRTWNGGYRPR